MKYTIDFRNDVQYILEESKKHSTIDTLAKKYFHTFEQNAIQLKKLKHVLTVFLLYEQMRTDLFYNENKYEDNIKNFNFLRAVYGYSEEDVREFIKNKKSKIDYRYDSFIASLLASQENKFSLPDNVKIITWNYDCQFELAFKQFQGGTFFDIQKHLGVYPLLSQEEESTYWEEIQKNKFKILHINGQAHYYKKQDDGKYISRLDHEQMIEDNLELMIRSLDNTKTDITFSWERNSSKLNNKNIVVVVDEAKRIMMHTKVIVIIGYSFPYFNREIDKLLFKDLGGIDKIYIQDLNGKKIKEHIITVYGKINPDMINVQEDISQFILPAELD